MPCARRRGTSPRACRPRSAGSRAIQTPSGPRTRSPGFSRTPAGPHTAEGAPRGVRRPARRVGARQVEAYKHVATFRDAEADDTYHGIVQDVEEGYTRRMAFIQPVGPVWPLPLYELALMTAERAESMDIRGPRHLARHAGAAPARRVRSCGERRRHKPPRASRHHGLHRLACDGPRRAAGGHPAAERRARGPAHRRDAAHRGPGRPRSPRRRLARLPPDRQALRGA